MKKLVQRTIGWVLLLALIAAQVLIPAPLQANAANVTTAAAKIPAATDIQNGVTLHCWNWSFKNIEANMAKIASLGYTAIQVPPIQQAKQSTKGNYMSDWWVYYQPAAFQIDNTGKSALGTKAEFQSLCATAEKYGIYVIVDVVANHMGDNGANKKSPAIIDDLENDSSCWHDISRSIDNYYDRYNITQYCMDGVPDLNTGNKKVQNYVLNYLKECIDAGADGFRFDAVKHIETPDDNSSFASDFWPTVVNGAKTYASGKGLDLYCYGELLWHPDENSTVSDKAYTKYFSVTDNSWSNFVRNEVIGNKNAGAFSYSYHKDATADQLVLWAESHDNYAGDGSKNMSVENINKTWALVAARADAMGLYLARPQNMYPQLLGAVTTGGWDSNEVKAVNHFHNAFAGQSEWVSNQNGIAYVERGTSGAVLVNCGGTSTSVSVTANTMANGTYKDQVSGNTFTVSGGKITGNIGSTGIAVVYNAVECKHESHNANGICTTCNANVGHNYGTTGTCACGAVKPADRVIYFTNSANWSKVNIYSWYTAGGEIAGVWPGTAMTKVEGNIYSYTLPGDAENVIFNNGTDQTDDLTVPTLLSGLNMYDFATSKWGTYDDGNLPDVCTHPSHNIGGTCTTCGMAVEHTYVNGTCVCGATETTGGSSGEYYVFYTTDGDSYNDYDYAFVDGKVTVTFSETSYVWVINSQGIEYMTDGWQGEVTSVTLKNTADITGTCDKLMVPAGTVTFTLVENKNDTLTLSYGEGGNVDPNPNPDPTPDPDPSGTDYYLFGYINGANYACEEDAANMGTYKFVNGKLTATFAQDSYVAVKKANNADWYMTNGWQGTDVTSVTLYSTSITAEKSDKLYVPGGVEVTFTLVEGADNTLTLSYTTGGTVDPDPTPDPDPDPSGTDYYLFGYINGANYACEEDAANMGSYKFVDGKVTATFTEDSYVAVKEADNAAWYMTDGWLGTDVTSATLYNTSITGEDSNKLYVPGGVAVTFTLVENADGTLTLSYTTGGTVDPDPDPDPTPDAEYFLFYTTDGDSYNDYDYAFVDGKVTVTFSETSYVWVINKQGVEYMTDGWQGEVTSVTLKNTADITGTCDKLMVPAGVEVTFTLVENSNDTLTLSYAPAGTECDHSYTSKVTTAATCTTAGVKTFTCSKCGDSYTESIPVTDHNYVGGSCSACGKADPDFVKPVLTLKYPTVSFEDEIIMNIFFAAENLGDITPDKMGLITFTSNVANGTIENADAVIPGAELNAAAGFYCANTKGIAAKNLGDKVYFRAYVQLADGSYVYSNMANYSPMKYAYSVLNGNYGNDMKALVAAMLNYGAAAQVYFNHNTDALVNADMTAAHKALVKAYSSDMIAPVVKADSAKAANFVNNGGFSRRYPSISFESAFSINYFFAPAYSVDGDITLYYWTTADYNKVSKLTTANATGSVVATAGSEYEAAVKGIAAKDLDGTIYVAAVYKSNGTTYGSGVLAYSIGAYCLDRITNGSASMQSFASATAVYGYYAKAYFSK